jgi:hypothetical protein
VDQGRFDFGVVDVAEVSFGGGSRRRVAEEEFAPLKSPNCPQVCGDGLPVPAAGLDECYLRSALGNGALKRTRRPSLQVRRQNRSQLGFRRAARLGIGDPRPNPLAPGQDGTASHVGRDREGLDRTRKAPSLPITTQPRPPSLVRTPELQLRFRRRSRIRREQRPFTSVLGLGFAEDLLQIRMAEEDL